MILASFVNGSLKLTDTLLDFFVVSQYSSSLAWNIRVFSLKKWAYMTSLYVVEC